MHLFLVVLGGRSRGCHIEQHDVRFVAGRCIEDTLPALRRQWFGLPSGLHIDSWLKLERVEGRRLALRREPSGEAERLWFVNVGAYDPDQPAELHAFGLFIAASAAAASARAKRHLLVGAAQQHKDDICPIATTAVAASATTPAAPRAATSQAGAAVDDVLALDQVGRWHVHLLPAEPACSAADQAWQPLRPDWFGYWRIDRPGA